MWSPLYLSSPTILTSMLSDTESIFYWYWALQNITFVLHTNPFGDWLSNEILGASADHLNPCSRRFKKHKQAGSHSNSFHLSNGRTDDMGEFLLSFLLSQNLKVAPLTSCVGFKYLITGLQCDPKVQSSWEKWQPHISVEENKDLFLGNCRDRI